MKKNFLKSLVVASIFLLCTSCGGVRYQNQLFVYDTICSLDFVADELTAKNIEDYVLKMHLLCDAYNEHPNMNNIFTINHSTDFVEVDEDLLKILKKSIEYFEFSEGYFNPLIGGLSSIYKKSIKDKKLPDQNEVKKELEIMKNSKLVFNNNKVKIEGGAKLDLGGITKGFVLEEIYKNYKFNSSSYMFNFGTSSILLGKTSSYGKFDVHYNDEISFNVSDCAISTSAVDEQHMIINNQEYSHIINTIDGLNIPYYQAVIVIGNSEDSGLLDAMSTAFMVMDLGKIEEFSAKIHADVNIIKDNKFYTCIEGN